MKKYIRLIFHFLRLEISYYRPESTSEALFFKMLKKFDINTIFDIGANEGQFGGFIRNLGFRGSIVSFEPLTQAYQKLQLKSSGDVLWSIAPQMAIGDKDGNVKINIANNSESSSILTMLKTHEDAEGNSAYTGTEIVRISKLDSIYSSYVQQDSKIFLKIDTQGYEDRVLRGASNLLEQVVGLQIELSLTPLYSNQILFDEMIDNLKKMGFELWLIMPVFSDLKTGRLLQVDATFFRTLN